MSFSTLDEWLEWQETLHPSEIDLGLQRVQRVWDAMDGELTSLVITIAGTNGKGSSAALLESILIAGGYSVGCYTSPHLLRYNERIRVNGVEASDQDICAAFSHIDQARDDASITYFEFGTLAALEIFSRSNLDVVILEVGLGGRLDAVNIIDPDVAVITTIDIDHTQWLGDTREKIALEKAGILRAGKPAVFSATNPPTTLIERADELGVNLNLAGKDFSFRKSADTWEWCGKKSSLSGLPVPGVSGEYIYQNCAGVLMALELVHQRLPLSIEAVRAGISTVSLPGRFQILPGEFPIILDVAHNPEAARELANNLLQQPVEGRTIAVFSALGDKDIRGVVSPLLDIVDDWYLGRVDAERASGTEEMKQELIASGIDAGSIKLSNTLKEAMTKAMAEAGTHDRLVVFGSFYTVAQILQHPGIVSRQQLI